MIKLHPMDPGFRAWGRIIANAASRVGAADRVVFVENGSFEFLVKRCAGVVTVNSTAGVTAIKAGKPVKTLGEAVYDIPGLTFQGPLDEFWCKPGRPDPALAKAYIKLMAACIQVKGGFFSESGLAAAVDGAAKRLHEGLVNAPICQVLLFNSRIDGLKKTTHEKQGKQGGSRRCGVPITRRGNWKVLGAIGFRRRSGD